MKGISPMIATVLIIAFTIAIGGVISVFMNRLTTTQIGETEKSSTGIIECSNARIDILSVTGAGVNGSIVITNPSSNKIYITGIVDNVANSSTVPDGYKILTSGNTTTLYNIGITNTSTKIMIVGLCENAARTQNVSIQGTCPKGGSCWPS